MQWKDGKYYHSKGKWDSATQTSSPETRVKTNHPDEELSIDDKAGTIMLQQIRDDIEVSPRIFKFKKNNHIILVEETGKTIDKYGYELNLKSGILKYWDFNEYGASNRGYSKSIFRGSAAMKTVLLSTVGVLSLTAHSALAIPPTNRAQAMFAQGMTAATSAINSGLMSRKLAFASLEESAKDSGIEWLHQESQTWTPEQDREFFQGVQKFTEAVGGCKGLFRMSAAYMEDMAE